MAGRACAVPVRLSSKRRRKLEQIIAAGTSPQRLVLRARIVMLAAGGMTNAQIARQLGCGVAVVRTWRGRFMICGIPGLSGKPRSGRPETHGPSARLAVIAVATSVPPEGESQWSRPLIAGHLRDRGLAISASTVSRVLAGAKVRPHKVRGWLNRADDPSFWLRAGQVCRLYLDPPPGTVLISIDEKTGIQAKCRPSAVLGDLHAEACLLAQHEVEQWFGVLARRVLRRGDFGSRDDLEAKITAFTIRHNKNARPYKWSYDADAEHARYLERHPQPGHPHAALPEAA